MSGAFTAAGRFGPYGGAYIPETLVAPVEQLCSAWEAASKDPTFWTELNSMLAHWAGRPPAYPISS